MASGSARRGPSQPSKAQTPKYLRCADAFGAVVELYEEAELPPVRRPEEECTVWVQDLVADLQPECVLPVEVRDVAPKSVGGDKRVNDEVGHRRRCHVVRPRPGV